MGVAVSAVRPSGPRARRADEASRPYGEEAQRGARARAACAAAENPGVTGLEWRDATRRESSLATTLYHNPRCSKSRAGLALLREQGIEPEVIEYLKDPPDAETLSALLDLLGLGPRELMRTKEPEYRALHLDDPALTREALIAAMVANPRLIERPILVKDGRAALGRPPERLLEIL